MRSRSRPKGYILDWRPQPKTLVLLDQVQQVLNEYRDYLPLTARQVFYRMVGQHGYDKTEQAYARLCEAMVKARRAGALSWHAIRDDGTVTHGAGGFDAPEEWWESELSAAKAYGRDRSAGQDARIELWCEAAGMAPQLARVARPYGVPVYSTGGFSSVTVTYEIAQRVAGEERPTVFLHVGDYDPSGESIFNAMAEDVSAFVNEDVGPSYYVGEEHFRPERVALTEGQVTAYNLPTAPPKRTDSRSARWLGETCQAEAMDPATLGQIVKAAIESHMDMRVYRVLVADEERERDEIVAEVERILEDRK